jgi:uncharacterized protein (DUF1697 family)
MQTYISLLRGINVSGQKKVRMEELKALYVSLGYERVTTYIQSGNVVFAAPGKQRRSRLETAIRERFGFEVPVVLRSDAELEAILAANPFLARHGIDESRLHVVFLQEAPSDSALERLADMPIGEDEYRVNGSEIYLHCPNGYGRSKLSNSALEKKLGLMATTRNWKTVNQLHRIARPEPAD